MVLEEKDEYCIVEMIGYISKLRDDIQPYFFGKFNIESDYFGGGIRRNVKLIPRSERL